MRASAQNRIKNEKLYVKKEIEEIFKDEFFNVFSYWSRARRREDKLEFIYVSYYIGDEHEHKYFEPRANRINKNNPIMSI